MVEEEYYVYATLGGLLVGEKANSRNRGMLW